MSQLDINVLLENIKECYTVMQQQQEIIKGLKEIVASNNEIDTRVDKNYDALEDLINSVDSTLTTRIAEEEKYTKGLSQDIDAAWEEIRYFNELLIGYHEAFDTKELLTDSLQINNSFNLENLEITHRDDGIYYVHSYNENNILNLRFENVSQLNILGNTGFADIHLLVAMYFNSYVRFDGQVLHSSASTTEFRGAVNLSGAMDATSGTITSRWSKFVFDNDNVVLTDTYTPTLVISAHDFDLLTAYVNGGCLPILRTHDGRYVYVISRNLYNAGVGIIYEYDSNLFYCKVNGVGTFNAHHIMMS